MFKTMTGLLLMLQVVNAIAMELVEQKKPVGLPGFKNNTNFILYWRIRDENHKNLIKYVSGTKIKRMPEEANEQFYIQVDPGATVWCKRSDNNEVHVRIWRFKNLISSTDSKHAIIELNCSSNDSTTYKLCLHKLRLNPKNIYEIVGFFGNGKLAAVQHHLQIHADSAMEEIVFPYTAEKLTQGNFDGEIMLTPQDDSIKGTHKFILDQAKQIDKKSHGKKLDQRK